MSLPWKGVIIHHSLTADSGSVSWDAIRRHHTDPNGPPAYRMRDIGYHAGIERVGNTYEVLFGRPLDWYGAHCRGKNRTHLGFLFVGNFDLAPPPIAMLRVACERVLRPWLIAFGFPTWEIRPHREFARKSCPGNLFDMGALLRVFGSLEPGDIHDPAVTT